MATKKNRARWKRKKNPSTTTADRARWVRNKALAAYAGVSVMTIHRWKRLPGFPPAAVICGIEHNNLEQFDNWMHQQKLARSSRSWLQEGREASGLSNLESAA
jgi:hypothetical protein